MSELTGVAVAKKVHEIIAPLNKERKLMVPRKNRESDTDYAMRVMDILADAIEEITTTLARLNGFIEGVLISENNGRL